MGFAAVRIGDNSNLVFAVVLMIALKVAGYYGVLASQAISDFLTAVLAVVLVWRWWKKVDF